MIKLKDISEKTGYSVSVVSRALKPNRDKFDTTSEKTKEYIRKVAAEMGYSSNINASSLRRGRTPAIGIFLPSNSSSLVAELVFGFSNVSMEHKYPLFYAPGYTTKAFAQFLRNAERMSKIGIIVYFGFNNIINDSDFQQKVKSGGKNDVMADLSYEDLRKWNKELYDALTLFVKNGGKVIFLNETPIDYDYEALGIRSVCCDDNAGGELAAEYLLAHNCKSFVCIRKWRRCWRDRYIGFEKHLAENNKKCIDIDFLESVELSNYERLSERLDQELTGLRKPVGIFITSDMLLLEIYNYCLRNNWIVGKDVILISYNDQEFVRHLNPPVSSIRQPMRKAGEVTMTKMLEMLNGKDADSEIIRPELVAR